MCDNFKTPSLSQNIVTGGNSGNVLNNSVYEFNGRLLKVSSDTVFKFDREGGDADPALPAKINLRPYTISTMTWGSEFTVYDSTVTAYTIANHFVKIINNQFYLYLVKYLRATPNDGNGIITLTKSTDLTGTSWGSETTIRANESGRPNISGWLTTDDPNKNYLVLVGETASKRINLFETNDNGETFTQGPMVLQFGSVNYNEGDFLNISNGRIIGVLRDQAGSYLYQVNSSDYGLTWTAPFSTGIGASSGIKVTPKIIKSADNPNRVTTYFYDRGDGRAKISSQNSEDDAFNGVWLPIYLLGLASQGNGSICVIDDDLMQYLIYTAKETGEDTDPTNTLWWVYKDVCEGGSGQENKLVLETAII